MRPKEYLDLLVEIEALFPVNHWSWQGIDVWPLLRVGLGFHLDDHANTYLNRSLLHHGFQLVKDHFTCALAELQDRSKNQNQDQTVDVVFLSLSTERGFKLDGAWYNLYCDPLRSQFRQGGIDSLILESASAGIYRVPRHSPSIFIQPRVNRLAAKSVLFDNCPDYHNWEMFIEFVRFLENRASVTELGVRSIVKRLSIVRRWTDNFKTIFDKTKPKLGFVVSYYGPLGMSFVQACREFGIPSVDLQHGVQGPSHVAYGKWTCIPPSGYTLLPSIFWCWDSASKMTIDEWTPKCHGRHRSIVGGNPILSEFIDDSSPLSQFFDSRVREICLSSNANILVTLQPGDCNPNLIRIIQESPKDWFWWIRIHPTATSLPPELIEVLERFCKGRFDWANASSLPLYALLKAMNLHVTNFSSSVLEAERFGLRTVLLHSLGQDYYSEQIKSGVARIALDWQSGIKVISETLHATRLSTMKTKPVNPLELMVCRSI